MNGTWTKASIGGKGSWWTDRICTEFDPHVTAERHLVANVLPYFEQRWGLRSGTVGLLGVGMGGQGALRLAFKYPKLFPVVAAISPALDYHDLYNRGFTLDEMYDSKEQCRQDTAILHINPTEYPPHIFFCMDPTDIEWYRGADRLHEKLTALGIPHQIDFTTRAGGHSWTYFNQMAERALRFLRTALEQQSRRLL
jgi:S-formylglutathione hydrolase